MQSILDAATLVPSKSSIDKDTHHKGNGYASLSDIIQFAIVPDTERSDVLVYSIQGIIEQRKQRDKAKTRMAEHVTRRVIHSLYGAEVVEDAEGSSSWLADLFGSVITDGAKAIGVFAMRTIAGIAFDILSFLAEDVIGLAARALVSWVVEPVLLAGMAVFANPIGLAALAALGTVGAGWWLLNKLLGKGGNGTTLEDAHVEAMNSSTVPSTSFRDFTPSGAAYPRPAASPTVTNQQPEAVPYTGSSITQENAAKAAIASEQKWGIPAVVSLAQFNLESGFGKHMPRGSNNPFGIKAREGQPYVEAMTTEHVNGRDIRIVQKFRKFSSMDEAFDEHARLLATGRPYAHARQFENNPTAFAGALQGVYATDPNYAAKLTRQFPTLMGLLASVNKDATVSVQTGPTVADKAIAATSTDSNKLAATTAKSSTPIIAPPTAKTNKTILQGPGKILVAVN